MQIEKIYELYGKLGELHSKMGFRTKYGLMMLSDLSYLEIEREKS